ncbi:MAG TPA: FtsX-like permease family protein [Steroidobacteraceae bacterium]|nr:FtsX-like permease family protein [Steroidobacteraceae bacterium]
MELLPILKSLRRNKIGAALIALQIALTLAIVCNSLTIIQRHLEQMHRPSGVDEPDTFTFANQWVGQPEDLEARVRADLAAIRATPGVVDAIASNSFPLRGGGWSTGLNLKPDQKFQSTPTSQYFVDEHGLAALGLHLVAGRWFTPAEVGVFSGHEIRTPPSVVVTQDLARALFPSGNALGQEVYDNPDHPSRIVGIVERAQTPWPAFSWGESFIEKSTFEPYLFVNNDYMFYIVRARPGQLATVMREVQDRLYAITRQRVIQQVHTFAETRSRAYALLHSTSVLLTVVCAMLLAITVFGIVGLTMYWVAQRRRQIGMRRALGARRADILRYFHTENLLIAGSGAVLGIALGLGANLYLATHLELGRMSVAYICAGAAIVLAVSQAAVFWPALRAASISPAIATRGM